MLKQRMKSEKERWSHWRSTDETQFIYSLSFILCSGSFEIAAVDEIFLLQFSKFYTISTFKGNLILTIQIRSKLSWVPPTVFILSGVYSEMPMRADVMLKYSKVLILFHIKSKFEHINWNILHGNQSEIKYWNIFTASLQSLQMAKM